MQVKHEQDRVDILFDEENPVQIGAALLAVCAYPSPSDLLAGGRADRLYRALLSDFMRIAKRRGKLRRLPQWIVPTREMRTRINSALERLRLIRACHEIFMAELLKPHRPEGATFTIDSSRDFSRFTLTFNIDQKNRLVPRPTPPPLSLTAAIKKHQPAFLLGEDELGSALNDGTKNIRKRYFSQYIRIFPIYVKLHSEILKVCGEEAWELRYRMLLLNTNWQIPMIQDMERAELIWIALAKQHGIRSIDPERMVHVRLVENYANFDPTTEGSPEA